MTGGIPEYVNPISNQAIRRAAILFKCLPREITGYSRLKGGWSNGHENCLHVQARRYVMVSLRIQGWSYYRIGKAMAREPETVRYNVIKAQEYIKHHIKQNID
jgi:hypothetical protein|tara:strand:+ start:242 stop:550 length:309 start_codon:yes stop_codon:yes gene_type:complete